LRLLFICLPLFILNAKDYDLWSLNVSINSGGESDTHFSRYMCAKEGTDEKEILDKGIMLSGGKCKPRSKKTGANHYSLDGHCALHGIKVTYNSSVNIEKKGSDTVGASFSYSATLSGKNIDMKLKGEGNLKKVATLPKEACYKKAK